MRIYQRMLYVGLGGTGLKIGSRLEQALRNELCGASGTELRDGALPQLQPFQLPSCLQFVYFDFDESARAAARNISAERIGRSLAELNSQAVNNLTPRQNSYGQCAEMLRIRASAAVESWLPPEKGVLGREPGVSPLSKGAGELPTAGRAALFETLRVAGGIGPIEASLAEAIKRLNDSTSHLRALAGDTALNGFDLFVGFSVAGGTGAGIFYDVLRILATVAEQNIDDAGGFTIFPLVVLPSAFARDYPEKRRAHMLNGGPALRELFQLIDNKNTAVDNPSIRYPGDTIDELSPHVPTPTAFLFARPETGSLDDLHRSIVSFVVSNIGTVIPDEGGNPANVRPMMANLIDQAAHVHEDAPDGVGQHPAAPALAAEIRIPIEEIAEILSERLLAQATRQLSRPSSGEDIGALFDRFAGATKLDLLVDRKPEAPLGTAKRVGAKEISAYLYERNRQARQKLHDLRDSLHPKLATLAAEFDYMTGFQSLLNETDIFRAHRVVCGHPENETEILRTGMYGFIFRRGEEPPPNPDDFGEAPPSPPSLRDPLQGLVKLGLNNPLVVDFLERQNRWYAWRVKVEYYEAWRQERDSWVARARQMRERLDTTKEAFDSHATAEPRDFGESCKRLYDDHTSVIYFLPPGGQNRDLDSFYQHRLLPRLGTELRLGESPSPGAIVAQLMSGRWSRAFEATLNRRSEGAFEYTLGVIRNRIGDVLSPTEGAPLLPPIAKLLQDAAYLQQDRVDHASAAGRTLDSFMNTLSGLLPGDFRPPGWGDLGIEMFYPAPQEDEQLNRFLTRTCLERLGGTPHFHALDGIDFISVVLRRLSQNATAIEEYRHLMTLRAHALMHPRWGDALPWRQRLGYEPCWLVLRENERARVLFALLNAIHDGAVQIADGTEDDPRELCILQLDAPTAGAIVLTLRQPVSDTCSAWADIVCAYERYVLGTDEHGRARCEKLLELDKTTTQAPSELYVRLIKLRDTQKAASEQLLTLLPGVRELLEQLPNARPETHGPVEYQFWWPLMSTAMAIPMPDGRTHDRIAQRQAVGTADAIGNASVTGANNVIPGYDALRSRLSSPAKPASDVAPPPVRIFLCHSSSDKAKVRELYHRLQQDGLAPWFDEENLVPGQDWDWAIRKAIREAKVVAVCLSRASTTKAGYVQNEIRVALDVADQQPEGAIFVIPVRLEECSVPDRLGRLHWVDLFDEGGYTRLLRALNTLKIR